MGKNYLLWQPVWEENNGQFVDKSLLIQGIHNMLLLKEEEKCMYDKRYM